MPARYEDNNEYIDIEKSYYCNTYNKDLGSKNGACKIPDGNARRWKIINLKISLLQIFYVTMSVSQKLQIITNQRCPKNFISIAIS